MSHHHSTCALVSKIIESVLQTVQEQFTYRQYILTDLYRRQCAKYTYIYSVPGASLVGGEGWQRSGRPVIVPNSRCVKAERDQCPTQRCASATIHKRETAQDAWSIQMWHRIVVIQSCDMRKVSDAGWKQPRQWGILENAHCLSIQHLII